MIRDELLHTICLEQQLIPFRGRELIGNASAGRAAIVMQRCPVDVAQRPWTFLSEFLEKTVGPGIIVDVRIGGDESESPEKRQVMAWRAAKVRGNKNRLPGWQTLRGHR